MPSVKDTLTPDEADRSHRISFLVERILAVIALLIALAALVGQITTDRLVQAGDEPRNWLTYSGAYSGQRYSTLTQIDPGNVKSLGIEMDPAEPGRRSLGVLACS